MGFFMQRSLTPVLLAECCVGVTLNVFIVAVQMMKWKAVKSLEAFDQILLCLGISRSLYMTNIFLIFLTRAYFPGMFKDLTFSLASAVASFLLYFSCFWFVAVLCVLYCVKIANYKHKVFILMKTRISRLVSWFIVASLLISALFSIPCAWSSIFPYWQNSANSFSGNVTVSDAGLHQFVVVELTLIIVGSSIPFSICCGSISLLIHSLWMHIRQMSCSGTGFRNPNVDAHITVVRNMSVFLFIQVIILGCNVSYFFTVKYFGSSSRVFFTIIACGSIILHSAYMIYSNANLNQAFRGMWNGLIRRLSIHL